MIHALNAKLELIIIRRGQSRLVLTESYHLNDSLKMDECWKLFFYLKKSNFSNRFPEASESSKYAFFICDLQIVTNKNIFI